MKSSSLQPLTRLSMDDDFDFMPLFDEVAAEAFGEWLDGELDQLTERWSAWTTRSSNAVAGRGAGLGR